MKLLYRILLDEDGPAAVEYAVMLALIIGTMILTLTATGHEASVVWAKINDGLSGQW